MSYAYTKKRKLIARLKKQYGDNWRKEYIKLREEYFIDHIVNRKDMKL